jgi:hypothetical protein
MIVGVSAPRSRRVYCRGQQDARHDNEGGYWLSLCAVGEGARRGRDFAASPHTASGANTSFTPQRRPSYHASRRPTSNSKPTVPPARLARESLCARKPSAPWVVAGLSCSRRRALSSLHVALSPPLRSQHVQDGYRSSDANNSRAYHCVFERRPESTSSCTACRPSRSTWGRILARAAVSSLDRAAVI